MGGPSRSECLEEYERNAVASGLFGGALYAEAFLAGARTIVFLLGFQSVEFRWMVRVEFFEASLGVIDDIQACIVERILDQIWDCGPVLTLAEHSHSAREHDAPLGPALPCTEPFEAGRVTSFRQITCRPVKRVFVALAFRENPLHKGKRLFRFEVVCDVNDPVSNIGIPLCPITIKERIRLAAAGDLF